MKEKLFITVLAVWGVLSTISPSPPLIFQVINWCLFAALMFYLGVLVDDALRRWELQPHWRKVKPVKPETQMPETLRLN